MNESEKEMFVKITSLSGKELENEITTLKEAISSKIDTILSESNDGDLSSKLSEVKNQLSETTNTKYEYYRLVQLKDGLEG
jgi:DNA-binding transcriptional regulator GbsR (MarR family)